MEKKQARSAVWLAALALLAVLLMLGGVTYAWFTFDPYTRVTPMEGKISEGSTNLLISESADGPFDKKCGLHPANLPQALTPVSTGTLTNFFAGAKQDRSGYTTAFRDITGEIGNNLVSGTVYLQCKGGSCTVFFDAPPLNLGTDSQWLAAGRLGLRITGSSGVKNYIFRLDALGAAGNVQTRQTVTMENAVVGANGQLMADPSVSIGDYLYREGGSAKALCAMEPDEIARVDYWVYLEGCDSACFNPVQSRDLVLQLGFIGRGEA